jgi:hypothetical protein
MRWRHDERMNAAELLRKHPWPAVVGMSAGLVAIVLSGFGVASSAAIRPGMPAVFNTVVQWRDASHDWLLVADGQSNQLAVYSAVDGRPLHRLDVKRGVNDAGAFAQRDGRLFVVSDDGKLGELKLPQLQMIASTRP